MTNKYKELCRLEAEAADRGDYDKAIEYLQLATDEYTRSSHK